MAESFDFNAGRDLPRMPGILAEGEYDAGYRHMRCGAVKHYLDAPPRRKRTDAAHPRQRRVKPEPGAVSVSRGDVSGDPLGTTPTDTAPPSLAVRLASDLMGEAS